jgi:REP element-mobilizing transposase RayT/DNA-binding transcriptional regulator YiaG
MPRQSRKLSENKTYHIMIRGNEKRLIFLDEEDKSRFIDILSKKNIDRKYSIYAYCLMDNHVHLLINEGQEELSGIMKRINVSYVYYFNKKYNRVGHLFQDRFKSEIIANNEHLLIAIRYIHNNPVKEGMCRKASQYRWSSFACFVNDKWPQKDIVEASYILELFAADKKRAITLFKEYSDISNDDVLIDYTEKAFENKSIINESDAKKYISDFLNSKKVLFESLKMDQYKGIRDELIHELREKSNLSIRRLAELLEIDRNIVQRTK